MTIARRVANSKGVERISPHYGVWRTCGDRSGIWSCGNAIWRGRRETSWGQSYDWQHHLLPLSWFSRRQPRVRKWILLRFPGIQTTWIKKVKGFTQAFLSLCLDLTALSIEYHHRHYLLPGREFSCQVPHLSKNRQTLLQLSWNSCI